LIKTKKILAWGEMASQVAHEIKNPLTPIKLSIQHLHYAYQQQDPNFKNILDECCNTIIEQIERLRHTSIEFSQFARTQQEEKTLEDINSIIMECVKLYSLGSKDIKFDIKLTDNLPQIKIGRDSIKRVFINLIENAMQAMKEGGKITITTYTDTRYEMRDTRDTITIEIQDTGIGIPAENLGKLFEPNFSTKTGGTGLGLAICKQVIDAHNGKIYIESTQDIGTKVTILLPC
jgi:two-component system nitrogen regulation sensor histidine kinase NtrY